MRRRPAAIATLTLGLCVLAGAAAAQPRKPAPARAPAPPRPERGYISATAGAQSTAGDISDRFRFDLFSETATIDVEYPGTAGAFVDAGAGRRLWKRLGAGASVSFATSGTTARAAGSLPHPFFLDRPRQFDGETQDLGRKEMAVHLHALYFVPPGRNSRWRIVLSAGPSYFHLRQDLAREVTYIDEYPHDTASFRGITIGEFTGSAFGVNAAADVTYRLRGRVGVGGMLRYAWASIAIDGPEDRRLESDAGGLQAGAGVRISVF